MANYVCTQLSALDSNGAQTCQTWTEYQPQSLVPDLSISDINALSEVTIYFLCTVFAYKILGRFLGRR